MAHLDKLKKEPCGRYSYDPAPFPPVRNNDLETLNAFLQAGIDPDFRGSDGQGLLHEAVEENNTEIAQHLLAHGADPNIKDEDGMTPTHIAAKDPEYNDILIVLLNAGANPDSTKKVFRNPRRGRWTPLHMASPEGGVNNIDAILRAGADVNAKDKNGKTALHHASFTLKKQAHLIKPALLRLLKGGADPNQINNEGESALFNAVNLAESAEIVAILLDHGANPLIQNSSGQIALHYAAGESDQETLALLAERSGVDYADNDGWTALAIAAKKGRVNAVKQLLSQGADPHISPQIKEAMRSHRSQGSGRSSSNSVPDEKNLLEIVHETDKSYRNVRSGINHEQVYKLLESHGLTAPDIPQQELNAWQQEYRLVAWGNRVVDTVKSSGSLKLSTLLNKPHLPDSDWRALLTCDEDIKSYSYIEQCPLKLAVEQRDTGLIDALLATGSIPVKKVLATLPGRNYQMMYNYPTTNDYTKTMR